MASKQFKQTSKEQFINTEGFTISRDDEDPEYWGLWVLRYPGGKVIDTDIYSVDLINKHGIELIYEQDNHIST